MQTGISYSHAKTSAARYSNYLIVLLGILTAFGPLVTDMYLPTLPSMTVYFGTSQSMVQMGLTASMAGLALGQLLFGPLSDKFGRRPLLLVSLLLFVASTVICIFSPTIYVFVGMRLFQGIGAAGGIVISRSVATDRYRGKELVKVLAVIGVINGIAPVAAPVLGGVLTDAVGWRGIFVILLAIGVILLGARCCSGSRFLRAAGQAKTCCARSGISEPSCATNASSVRPPTRFRPGYPLRQHRLLSIHHTGTLTDFRHWNSASFSQ